MIGNAKQDEQLFHHQRDRCNTGVQDASYGKNLKQDLVFCMQTDNGSGAFLYRVYGGRMVSTLYRHSRDPKTNTIMEQLAGEEDRRGQNT